MIPCMQSCLAFFLSRFATLAGLSSSALQSAVPVAEEDTNCRGVLVILVAGCHSLFTRSATYRFSSLTLLVSDVTIVHIFSGDHVFTADSLTAGEPLKNKLYQSEYGLQQGPDESVTMAEISSDTSGQLLNAFFSFRTLSRSASVAEALPWFPLVLIMQQCSSTLNSDLQNPSKKKIRQSTQEN